MKNPRHVWLLFAVAATVVFGALAWVSAEVLRLDARARNARRAARLEENVRLALWRMDAQAAQMLAGTAWVRAASGPPEEPVRLPPSNPYIAYGFVVDNEDNIWTQAPDAEPVPDEVQRLPQAESEPIEAAQEPVQMAQQDGPQPEGAKSLTYQKLASNLDAQPVQQEGQDLAQVPAEELTKMRYSDSPKAQQMVSRQEFQNRMTSNSMLPTQNTPALLRGAAAPASPMRAMWLDEQLVVARRLDTPGGDLLEGAVLDWPGLRAELLGGIRRDLLPEAELVPIPEGQEADPARMMASLPVRLLPGEVPLPGAPGPGQTVRIMLGTAWGAVLLAALAAALSLRGVLQLSERRADFVSAVTHELRTPLTTFRMYTEMLADGMVEDEAKRSRYLGTLKAEADRLGHLVENVLSYARLERTDAGRRGETLALGDALDRVVPRLEGRAGESGMELVLDVPDAARAGRVKVDPDALDHILLNLVDNACKYAARAEDRRVHLQAESDGNYVRLHVRDHGPGVAAEDARRIFRPFRKSAHQAARTAPGVGLGLALSRRMARRMGGDLSLAPDCPAGACFVLRLPRG
jgi:signal transduction histidine kinase